MPRYIRANTPGATYFFTVALEDRRAKYLTDHADVLRECVTSVRHRHPFVIDAMAVMPDHLHAIWTLPPEDPHFAMRWMLIKQGFSKLLRSSGMTLTARRKGEVELWQKRFWEHQIRDDDDYARHVDYIHFNPVKHGYVQRAVDWPHSSFHRYVREGRLPVEWGLAVDFDGAFGE